MSKPTVSLIGLNLWITLALIPLNIIQPTYAAGNPSSSCQTALRLVQAKLKAKPNLEIASINKQDLSQSYPDYPQGRPDQYVIAMRGSQVSNLLNSPRLLTTLATQIIRNCETVSLVGFGLANSGYAVHLGLMPNDSIQIFECLEPGRNAPDRPVWGKIFCV